MKLIKLILLTIVISFSFTNEINAQFLKKLKEKVQKAAEETVINKTAEKAAQETGKAMDSLLDIDPNYQTDYQKKYQKMLFQDGADIPIEEVYHFNTNVAYRMNFTNDNELSSIDYSMWFSDSESYMASEMKNIKTKNSKDNQIPTGMMTIIDDKNQAMVIIMEEQKMAQVISMSKIKEIANEENIDGSVSTISTIKKTGKSKKILGYHCEEFTTQTEDGKMSFWVTQDLKFIQKNMFLNLSKSLGGNNFENIPKAAKGFMMEMNFENISKNEKGSMVVTKISKKSKSINTKDYQMMNLSRFMQN